MQYHLNGYSGALDPLTYQFQGSQEPDFQTSLPAQVDVLIVGAGPAGQLLGAQLAQFPSLTTRIIEPRPGPLEQGQADGLQCRTIEIFEAFGFAERVLKEAYWVNETTFWSPTEDGKGLRRTGRIRDTEEGLSEFPHVILNQARLHGLWLDAMKWSPTRLEPSYNRSLTGLTIPEAVGEPVDVEVTRTDTGAKEHIKARYVVGCDGARSFVRRSLGLEMKGDFANQAWGVLDALVVTDFPDLRLKTAIHSASAGSILIIPREGGYLARFYIELDKLQEGERIASKNVTADVLIAQAKKIFQPYNFEVKHIGYWSVYEVGQRLTNHFDDVPFDLPEAEKYSRTPRVFIAGDACHTHSAKAGQGMNVSMNDTFNLGWKLAAVLHGTAHPKLLHTYSFERQAIAKLLIDFDREISRQFAAKPKSAIANGTLPATNGTTDRSSAQNTAASTASGEEVDPAVFQSYFTRQGRFMAGLETKYKSSLVTSGSSKHQHLATGFEIGTRFHSAQVLRLADAKPVQLGHVMKADGRWRIVILGSTEPPLEAGSAVLQACAWLRDTLIPKYTPRGWDTDALFDVRAVFQQKRIDLDVGKLPEVLLPRKGKFGIQDYEKVFTDEESYGFGGGKFWLERGVSKDGCIVFVRPDQYVAAVVLLSPEGCGEVEALVSNFMVEVKEGGLRR